MAFRSCSSFIIKVKNVTASVKRARMLILESGGTCSDDNEQGVFRGDSPIGEIEGTYATFSDSIAVTILRKPFFVPCRSIENKVREYFA